MQRLTGGEHVIVSRLDESRHRRRRWYPVRSFWCCGCLYVVTHHPFNVIHGTSELCDVSGAAVSFSLCLRQNDGLQHVPVLSWHVRRTNKNPGDLNSWNCAYSLAVAL